MQIQDGSMFFFICHKPSIYCLHSAKFYLLELVFLFRVIFDCRMHVFQVVTILFIFNSIIVAYAYPLHASCSLEWNFNAVQCDIVQNKLVEQIQKWTGPGGCETGGEKCLYTLTKNTTNEVQATHTTPKKHYVDKISLKFSPASAILSPHQKWFDKNSGGNGCIVQGYSYSTIWYAILDFGTNYCNLHNLLTGTGLDKLAGFKEVVSDHTCTEYSSADCNTY